MRLLLKFLFLLFISITSASSFSKIEDNSFLLEEAYQQELGIHQLIQSYQTRYNSNNYQYKLTHEMPITNLTHQLSYEVPFARSEESEHGSLGDMVVSYRWGAVQKEKFRLADRFGLVLPTGSVNKGGGNGVLGMDFMQAATFTLSDRWMNHINLGVQYLPQAKSAGTANRHSITVGTAGTSFVYLHSDNFNLLLEALAQTGHLVYPFGRELDRPIFTLNPGARFAIDLDYKETQMVPGMSFPVQAGDGPTEYGVFFYFSVEPKFI